MFLAAAAFSPRQIATDPDPVIAQVASVAGSHATATVLAITPQEIDLHVVPAGGCKEAAFTVTNTSDVPLTVAGVDTSCDCLTIDLPMRQLAPGDTLRGRARLDLRGDDKFTGGLGIEVKGLDQAHRILFTMTVNAIVYDH